MTDAAENEFDEEMTYLQEVSADDLLANHIFVLLQWAAVHLASTPPDLEGSRLVIDTLSAIVSQGDDVWGDRGALYRSAIAEIQQVYVRAQQSADS